MWNILTKSFHSNEMLLFFNSEDADDTEPESETCSSGSGSDGVSGCTDSGGPAKSRSKRFLRLPLLTTLGVQSRLIIPQIPVALS